MMMKHVTMMLALIFLTGAASMAWGHVSSCAHTHYVVMIGGYSYEFSSCDNPGTECFYAPCGEVGRCQTNSYWNHVSSDCDCQQVQYMGGAYLNTSGLHLGTVPSSSIAVGSVSTVQFIPESQYNELLVMRNDEEELARVFSIASGSLEIRWLSEDPEHIYGVLSFFDLVFPSYDFDGQPTGENHWYFTGPDWEVEFDREEGRITLGQSLPLSQSNSIWTEMGWMDMVLDANHADEGAMLINLHATLGDPQPVPVEPESWSALKSHYR
jgi:hypothetical protein